MTAPDPEMADLDDEELDTPPPTPERVLRRAWCIASVAWRAAAETFAPDDRAKAIVDVRAWIERTALHDELEEGERATIEAPAGELRGRPYVDASWRAEGLGVLAWALGVHPLPDHETLCDPFPVFRAIGFMTARPSTLQHPTLRSPDEIEWQALRLLGLHWRMRDFSLTHCAVDLVALASGGFWFGGCDLDGVALVGNDLAIGGRAIGDADPTRVRQCHSIAMERHQAIRWLEGGARVYSDVDTST